MNHLFHRVWNVVGGNTIVKLYLRNISTLQCGALQPALLYSVYIIGVGIYTVLNKLFYSLFISGGYKLTEKQFS